jgi:hypothetical protein
MQKTRFRIQKSLVARLYKHHDATKNEMTISFSAYLKAE